jgi:hypothetical protein
MQTWLTALPTLASSFDCISLDNTQHFIGREVAAATRRNKSSHIPYLRHFLLHVSFSLTFFLSSIWLSYTLSSILYSLLSLFFSLSCSYTFLVFLRLFSSFLGHFSAAHHITSAKTLEMMPRFHAVSIWTLLSPLRFCYSRRFDDWIWIAPSVVGLVGGPNEIDAGLSFLAALDFSALHARGRGLNM